MKKKILIVLCLLMIGAGIFFLGYERQREKKEEEKGKNIKQSYDFEYNSSMGIEALGNSILLYDGKKLVRKDMEFKDIFSIKINIHDFILKTMKSNIYLLDRNEKIIYKINDQGEVINQVKFVENAHNMYPLKNSDLLVQYNTSVNTDGILVYDENLKLKKNINYPSSLINTVHYDENKHEVLVSTQIVSAEDIINSIYTYDNMYEAQSINQYKNLVTIAMKSLSGERLLLDPEALYIMDESYKNISKISAQYTFEKMYVEADKIYIQDGEKNVKIYDKKGSMIEEKVFKEPIHDILQGGRHTVFLGKGNVFFEDTEWTTQKDIERAIALSNERLVLFFRGGVSILKLT